MDGLADVGIDPPSLSHRRDDGGKIAPGRGQGRRGPVPHRRGQAGDDHRGPPAHRRGHRKGAGHIPGPPSLSHRRDDGGKIVVGEDHIGRSFGYIGARFPHGTANVGGPEVAIAKELGIYRDGDLAVTGAELDFMPQELLEQDIEKFYKGHLTEIEDGGHENGKELPNVAGKKVVDGLASGASGAGH